MNDRRGSSLGRAGTDFWPPFGFFCADFEPDFDLVLDWRVVMIHLSTVVGSNEWEIRAPAMAPACFPDYHQESPLQLGKFTNTLLLIETFEISRHLH